MPSSDDVVLARNNLIPLDQVVPVLAKYRRRRHDNLRQFARDAGLQHHKLRYVEDSTDNGHSPRLATITEYADALDVELRIIIIPKDKPA